MFCNALNAQINAILTVISHVRKSPIYAKILTDQQTDVLTVEKIFLKLMGFVEIQTVKTGKMVSAYNA